MTTANINQRVDGKDGRTERRLTELGLVLPGAPEPIGNFRHFHRHENLLYLSGQGPLLESGDLARGKTGQDFSVEEAYGHARRTGLVLLSVMQNALGGLDNVAGVVKLLGFVNAPADFKDHPKVINGCSDLFQEVFEERGEHARSSVGVASLPGGIPVEIEAVVAVSPKD